jgi:site-specific DNA-methyltransferase (adenine-specific)
MCGDSTDKATVEALMDGEKADLMLTDPPYGIGADTHQGKKENGWRQYGEGGWDKQRPTNEWFSLGSMFSKNQIIWGGNYFSDKLTPSRCYIFWDKGINGDCDFADGELAWCSFNKVLRIAPIRYKGFLGADNVRIHPTQKPVKLYEWLLMNYAKEGDKILDTHLGSGSIAIACHNLGYDLTACELDTEYYEKAMERINNHKRQIRMF